MQIITYWKRGFLENYANFKGRDSRPEFWWFYLANIILSLGLILIGGAITGALSIIGNLYGFAALIPGIAAGVRRLHDTGKSGWMLLISLIPIVGAIAIIVLLAQPGTSDANEYGPPTSAETASGSGGITPPPPCLLYTSDAADD